MLHVFLMLTIQVNDTQILMSAMREQMNASRNVSTPMDRTTVLVELDIGSLQTYITVLVI